MGRYLNHLPCLLAASLTLIAGCAAPAPAPQPIVTSPPGPQYLYQSPPQPLPQPRDLSQLAPPPPPVAPAVVLTPEQRQRGERIAQEAMEKVLVTARKDPARMRRLIGDPGLPNSPSEIYLYAQLTAAFSDPAFAGRLAAAMSDAQIAQIEAHPGLAMEVANVSTAGSVLTGMAALGAADQKALLQIFGDLYDIATPAECDGMLSGGSAAAAGTAAPAAAKEQLFLVVDHMPVEEQHRFDDLLIKSMEQPRKPPPAPLSDAEQQLVQLNVRHYFNNQPDNVNQRFQAHYRNPAHSPDRCWVIGQVVKAMLTGDDDVVALGVRMFSLKMTELGNNRHPQ